MREGSILSEHLANGHLKVEIDFDFLFLKYLSNYLNFFLRDGCRQSSRDISTFKNLVDLFMSWSFLNNMKNFFLKLGLVQGIMFLQDLYSLLNHKQYNCFDLGYRFILSIFKMEQNQNIQTILRQSFPPLHALSKKGQNGRVAVIGGSYEFTGAPFYAAISSLKVGGDLAHIFCSKSAATAIKSYSPQVIVHPVFTSEEQELFSKEELEIVHQGWLEKILKWKNAIRSWVIGPGLGRDKYMHAFFPLLIKNIPEGNLVVIDADGIYFLAQHPSLFSQLKKFRTILTPNARELSFLASSVKLQLNHLFETYRKQEEITQIPQKQEQRQFSLFVKGREDLILTNHKSFIVRTQGGNKRCGGIGDIVSGTVAVCAHWNNSYGLVLASKIVKVATKIAYEKQGRGLTAPNIIKELPQVVNKLQKASL